MLFPLTPLPLLTFQSYHFTLKSATAGVGYFVLSSPCMLSLIKKALLVAAALGLLWLGFRYGFREVEFGARRVIPPISEDPAWATWQETRFDPPGFGVRHPASMPTTGGPDRTYGSGPFLVGGGTVLHTVILQKSRYPGTDFLAGFVSVAVGEEASDGESCFLLARAEAQRERMTKRETFGGTTFVVASMSGPRGGAIAERIVYHAPFHGRCVELTANIFRSAGGEGRDFDRVAAWKALTDVVHTFRPLDCGKEGC